jgi:hypothetical protein
VTLAERLSTSGAAEAEQLAAELASGRGSVQSVGLLVEFLGHGSQDQAYALVKLAMCKVATMIGLAPKLVWRAVHTSKNHIC